MYTIIGNDKEYCEKGISSMHQFWKVFFNAECTHKVDWRTLRFV